MGGGAVGTPLPIDSGVYVIAAAKNPATRTPRILLHPFVQIADQIINPVRRPASLMGTRQTHRVPLLVDSRMIHGLKRPDPSGGFRFSIKLEDGMRGSAFVAGSGYIMIAIGEPPALKTSAGVKPFLARTEALAGALAGPSRLLAADISLGKTVTPGLRNGGDLSGRHMRRPLHQSVRTGSGEHERSLISVNANRPSLNRNHAVPTIARSRGCGTTRSWGCHEKAKNQTILVGWSLHGEKSASTA